MERGKKTNFILRQFKKKSKRAVNKDYFTEFFYLNKNREVIEFLSDNSNILVIETFLKEFIPEEFKDFIKIEVLNEEEEKIKTWYYTNENVIILIKVNWGFKKQEITVEIDMDNFEITILDDEKILKSFDYTMFNDYLISFLTIQARTLAETFNKISNK